MIEARVSKDGMVAEVCVSPEPGETVTIQDIEASLHLEGVQIGIDKEAIAALLQNGDYQRFVPVAKGKPPVNGLNGEYQFYFSSDDGKPKVRADGSVDYSMTIANVAAGDLLAEYHAPTNGTFGYNVFARALAPVKGKPAKTLIPKNVRREENRFYAELNGHVSLNGSTLSVQNVYDVNGDADFAFGDIKFNGDIHVSGNICGGVTIRAEGTVSVDGVIEDARVYAGQNIIVNQGVHGRGAGKDDDAPAEISTVLEAGGFVKSRFVDHAVVRAGGNVFIDYSVGSVITAEGMVTASGTRSAIVGGRVTAYQGINVGVAGNSAETPTELRIDSSLKLRENLLQMQQNLRELSEQSAKTDVMTEELRSSLEQARKQLSDAEALFRQSQTAPIIVRGVIHRNVQLFFGDMGLSNQSEKAQAEFRKLSGRVLCKSIGSFSQAELTASVIDLDTQVLLTEKRKVLLIDDDVRLLRTVHGMLEETYQVAATTNGKAARKYLEKNSPELILLDYMMPDENGVEVLKSLRAWDKTMDIPVVFLTGLDDKKKILECLALHPAGYIMKPVSRDALMAKIHAILGDEE